MGEMFVIAGGIIIAFIVVAFLAGGFVMFFSPEGDESIGAILMAVGVAAAAAVIYLAVRHIAGKPLWPF